MNDRFVGGHSCKGRMLRALALWSRADRPTGQHDIIAHGVEHQLGRRPQLKFAHHRSTVGFDGLYADIENVGDLLVDLSLSDELDDLAFARCEPGTASLAFGYVREVFEYRLRDRRRDIRLAPGQRLDGGDKVRGGVRLQHTQLEFHHIANREQGFATWTLAPERLIR
jgi:hypothetical protein